MKECPACGGKGVWVECNEDLDALIAGHETEHTCRECLGGGAVSETRFVIDRIHPASVGVDLDG